VLSHVDGLLLDDLRLALLLCAVWAETLAALTVAVTRVATLLVEWLAATLCAVFLNNEVRGAAQVRVLTLDVVRVVLRANLVGVLADVIEELASLVILMGPPRHVIIGLLLLQALQDDLILARDFHQLALAGLSIQTLLVAREDSRLLGGNLRGLHADAPNVTQVGVRMRDSLRVLKNVGHLLEQDAIFPLDLSVPLFKHLIFLRLCLQMRVILRSRYFDRRLDIL